MIIMDDKKKDFYAVVSAIVKFIEKADAPEGPAQTGPQIGRNDLIENNK